MKLIISHQRNNITIEQDKKVLTIYPFDLAVGKISASIFENDGDMLIGTGAATYDNVSKGNVDDVWTQGAVRGAWQTPAGGSATSVDEMNCRISLSSTLAVTTTDQTAKTIVYIHPYKGDKVMLNVGGSWIRRSIPISHIDLTESQTGTTSNGSMVITGLTDTAQLCVGMEVTGTGVGASALIASIDSSTQITTDVNSTADGTVSITFKVPADTNIDFFLEDISGVVKLRMILWTDGSTRASALELVNGKHLLDSDNDYNFIGSGRTTDTEGETEDSLLKRFCINYYQAIPRKLEVRDATASWTYTSSTWRQMRNTAANKAEFIIPISELSVVARTLVRALTGGVKRSSNGIGLDAVNALAADSVEGYFYNSTGSFYNSLIALYNGFPGIGYHYLAPIERTAAGSITYYGGDYQLFEGIIYG